MNQVTPETTIGELCGHENSNPCRDYFYKHDGGCMEPPLKYYGFEKCGFAETLERDKGAGCQRMPLFTRCIRRGMTREA